MSTYRGCYSAMFSFVMLSQRASNIRFVREGAR